MRNSKRLRELEIKVIQMEMTVELLSLAINNIMELQEMMIEEPKTSSPLQSSLEAGKWYRNIKETP